MDPPILGFGAASGSGVHHRLPVFVAAGWRVISVPAGTPNAIVDKLHAMLNDILPLPQIIAIGMLRVGAPRNRALHQHQDRTLGQGHPARGLCRNGVRIYTGAYCELTKKSGRVRGIDAACRRNRSNHPTA
jgi:hypothetical protein